MAILKEYTAFLRDAGKRIPPNYWHHFTWERDVIIHKTNNHREHKTP
jgi:hypothetical protein